MIKTSTKLNAFILLGYYTNTGASFLVYKFRPERTGFNIYATAVNFPCIITLRYTESKKIVKIMSSFISNKYIYPCIIYQAFTIYISILTQINGCSILVQNPFIFFNHSD